jgi:hypothetical protein
MIPAVDIAHSLQLVSYWILDHYPYAIKLVAEAVGLACTVVQVVRHAGSGATRQTARCRGDNGRAWATTVS